MLKDLEKKRDTCKEEDTFKNNNTSESKQMVDDINCYSRNRSSSFNELLKADNIKSNSAKRIKHPTSKTIDVTSFIRSLNLNDDIRSSNSSEDKISKNGARNKNVVHNNCSENKSQKIKQCKIKAESITKSILSDQMFSPVCYTGLEGCPGNMKTIVTNVSGDNRCSERTSDTHSYSSRKASKLKTQQEQEGDRKNIKHSKSDSELCGFMWIGCGEQTNFCSDSSDDSDSGDIANGIDTDITNKLSLFLSSDEKISTSNNSGLLSKDGSDKGSDPTLTDIGITTNVKCVNAPRTALQSDHILREPFCHGSLIDKKKDSSRATVDQDVFRKTSVQCRLYNISRRRRTGIREKHELHLSNTPMVVDPVNTHECPNSVGCSQSGLPETEQWSFGNVSEESPPTTCTNDQKFISTFCVAPYEKNEVKASSLRREVIGSSSSEDGSLAFEKTISLRTAHDVQRGNEGYEIDGSFSAHDLQHYHCNYETKENVLDSKADSTRNGVKTKAYLQYGMSPFATSEVNSWDTISQNKSVLDRRSMSMECSSTRSSDHAPLTVCKQNSVPIIRVSSFDSEEPETPPEKQLDFSKLLMHQSMSQSKSYGVRKNRRRKSKQSFLRVSGADTEFLEQRPLCNIEQRVMSEPEQTVTDGCESEVFLANSNKPNKDVTKKSSKWNKALGAFRKTSLQQRAWENSRQHRKKLRERKIGKTSSVDS